MGNCCPAVFLTFFFKISTCPSRHLSLKSTCLETTFTYMYHGRADKCEDIHCLSRFSQTHTNLANWHQRLLLRDSKLLPLVRIELGAVELKFDVLPSKLISQVLIRESFNYLMFMNHLTFWTWKILLDSKQQDYIRILKVSALQVMLKQESIILKPQRSPVPISLGVTFSC